MTIKRYTKRRCASSRYHAMPGCFVLFVDWIGVSEKPQPKLCDPSLDDDIPLTGKRLPVTLLETGLSVRARKVIFRGRFQFADELTAERLRAVKNCGQATIAELLQWRRDIAFGE